MECRVGLPTDGIARWRCDICSLLNVYTNDMCNRCQEPMTEDRKKQNKIMPKRPAPSVSNRSTSNASSSSTSSNVSRRSSTTSSRSTSVRSTGSSNVRNKKTANMHGFSSKNNGKSTKVTAGKKDNKMKKLKREDLSERHLGYKSGKKRNINTTVRSKLNHDTAAYRAKHGAKNLNDKRSVIKGMKKGVQYATINDMTRNGFQTTLSNKTKSYSTKNMSAKQKNAANAGNAAASGSTAAASRLKPLSEKKKKLIRKLTDDRPVTPPPQRKKGQKRQGLIDRLQKAASGDIMANMRQGGRYARKQQIDMGEGKSLYAL